MSSIKRREFITLLCGVAAAWPRAARTQQAARISRIGLMANLRLPPIERFRKALQEMGHVEGRNLVIEYRFAEGREERYPGFASELVALPVDVIVTWGTPAAFAAKEATSQIPIVMGGIGDAVNTGLVSNLARPGGNITGFIALNVDLEEKRLELLTEVVPHLSRVAVLGNSLNPLNRVNLDTARRAGQRLSIALEAFEVRSSQEVEGALRGITRAAPECSASCIRYFAPGRAKADRRHDGDEQDSGYLSVPGIRGRRRVHLVWREYLNPVRTGCRLRRQNFERREAGQSPGATSDRVRDTDQLESSSGAWPDAPRKRAGSRRRGDRMIGRREFITLLGGAAATWPLAARAQQSERMRYISVLMTSASPQ